MENLTLIASQEAGVGSEALASFHIKFGTRGTLFLVDNLHTHVIIWVHKELVVLILCDTLTIFSRVEHLA